MVPLNYLLLAVISNLGIYIYGINIKNDEIDEYPKEIKHGIRDNDLWSSGKFYEYYIDIRDYEPNEENIFEIYTGDMSLVINAFIYTTLTNATEEEIKNYSIIPDDRYIRAEESYKLDSLTKENYLFMPYKKTSINQKYFVILINIFNEGYFNQKIFYSISKRIPTINLGHIENNNKHIFSENLESRNDIHLYYKFQFGKNISIFFFANETKGAIFSTNLSSFITYENNIFIIKKNNEDNISEVYLGLRTLENKTVNVTINLNNDDFYLLDGKERLDQKIYIEKINCKNKFYIIENYYESYDDKMEKFLIINKLYGNYSLKYYNSFQSINFDEYSEENNEVEILDKVVKIEGKLNIYILSCVTPSAFIFEFFSHLNEYILNINEGKEIKAFIDAGEDTKIIKNNVSEDFKKYKFFISLLNDYRNISQELNGNFPFQNQFILNNDSNKIDKIMYYGNSTDLEINSENGAFIHFYLTSNLLFYNVIEGETIVDKVEKQNLVFKIKKDSLFDYITLEAETESNNLKIIANYDLKLLNKEVIEQNSKIMAPLPGISLPETNSIKLKFSNPYNKFDYPNEYNNDENDFYLFISFVNLNISNPIYVNIRYNYNEQIKPLSQGKSEIIELESEYEIYGNQNYLNKSKLLFNINKCNCSKNYSLINYYENNDNIITKNILTQNREMVLVNNLYFNTKMKINSIDDDNNNENINYYPADYYNNGDIYLNYFLVNEEIYDQVKITTNFEISYEDDMRSETSLSWNEFVTLDNNRHIATNYSIYLLPKNSIINSICQLSLIPSNKSIINSTNIDIDLDEGEYKVAIIASVIDEQFPIVNMYEFLNMKVKKRLNIALIVSLSVLGFIIFLAILIFLFRKKRKFLCFKRRNEKLSSNIEENKNKKKKVAQLDNTNCSGDESNELKKEIDNNESDNISEYLIDNKMENKHQNKDNNDGNN